MRKVGWTEGKETDALVFEGRNSSKGRCREAPALIGDITHWD